MLSSYHSIGCGRRIFKLTIWHSRHLENGIFELRGKVGTDIVRVLYFFYYEGKIVFTNGFVKKTQKTPREKIRKAKEYRKDYIERSQKNEKI